MHLAKKILHNCFLICFIAFLASCENRCYEIEEFDSHYITLKSYPGEDRTDGTYDSVNGGQSTLWNEAKGLQADGNPFIIRISGAWTAWNRQSITNEILLNMDSCVAVDKMCAKKANGTSDNCICYEGQTPVAELSQTCTSSDYANPALCSCDPDGGNATDYGVYHFPTNYYTKDEVMVNPDYQSMCKFDRGMGAYIGLFGPRGVTDPIRLYHLYSEGETVCLINLRDDGECKDGNGVDKTAYIFRSQNDATGNPSIFMKDDHDGNDGTNTDTSNDEYHVIGEKIKFKIYDRYYSDNRGNYNITILSGAGYGSGAGYNGILEFLVAIVEDTLMGKPNSAGEREGGIVEYMYKSITQDSGFILFVQMMLVMYVSVFGMAILMGVVEIKRSELMARILKVGLILLFTSSSSWAIYNQIVVGFFYDSMNYVVTMMTSLSNCALDTQTTTKLIQSGYNSAACLTDNNGSVYATPTALSESSRFGYIDLVIMTLLSQAVAAKVFALLLPSQAVGFIFGPLYIIAIFALIAYFIQIMLIAAATYAMNLMKIIFVLALGPVFMCFTLFSQTNQMFKNWLSFLGARSLENIMIFSILFNFVVILNTHFIDMLSYKACVENLRIGIISIPILKSHADRGLMEWMVYFFTIGGLLFMTKEVLKQIPKVAGGLISIGGVSGQGAGGGQSSMDFASKSVSGATGLVGGGAMMAGSAGLKGAGIARQGLGIMAEKSGVSSAISKAGDKLNLSGRLPRSISKRLPTLSPAARTVNAEIKVAQKAAKAAGLTGKAANDYVRKHATAKLMDRSLEKNSLDKNTQNRDPRKFALMGITPKFIADQMDRQLKEEPLKNLMEKMGKDLNSNKDTAALTRKEKKQLMREGGSQYLQKDHGMSKKDADNFMKKQLSSEHQTAFQQDLKAIIKESSKISTAQAARMTAENPELKDKFMQNFKAKEAKENYKTEKAWDAKQQSPNDANSQFGKAAIRMANTANQANAYRKGMVDSIGKAGGYVASSNASDNRKRYERELARETSKSKGRLFNPLTRSGKLRGAADFMSSTVVGRDISGGATAKAEQSNREAILKNLQSNPKDNIEKKHGFEKRERELDRKLTRKEEKQNAADKAKAEEKEKSARLLFQKQLNASAAKDLKADLKEISNFKNSKYDAVSASLKGQDIAQFKEMKAVAIDERQKDLFRLIKADLLTKDADGKEKFVATKESLFERVGKLDKLNKEFGHKPSNLQKGLAQDFKDVVKEGVEQTKKDAAALKKSDADYANKKELIDKNVAQLKSMESGLFSSDTSDNAYYDQIAQRFSKRMDEIEISKIAQDIAQNSDDLGDGVNDARNSPTDNDNRTSREEDNDANNIANQDSSKKPNNKDEPFEKEDIDQVHKDINKLHEENRFIIADLEGLDLDGAKEPFKYEKHEARKEEIEAIAALFNNGALGENSDRAQVLLAELAQITEDKPTKEGLEKVEAIVRELDQMKDDMNDTQSVDEATGLVNSDVKIEFGASISDILMQEADVGIQGVDFSKIFLGVQGDGNGMDKALHASLMIDKTQAEGMLKISKMKMKMATYELDQKKAELSKMQQNGADMSKISDIESAISQLEQTVLEHDSSVKNGQRSVENISSNLLVVESSR